MANARPTRDSASDSFTSTTDNAELKQLYVESGLHLNDQQSHLAHLDLEHKVTEPPLFQEQDQYPEVTFPAPKNLSTLVSV